MKLFNIPNAKSFYEVVLACQGRVFRDDETRTRHDLKSEAQYLISSGVTSYMGGIERLDISVENPRDAQMLMRYSSQMFC